MEEIWKDIENYERLYQVSNLGRIKRLTTFRTNKLTGGKSIYKEHILKPQINGNEYYYVILCKQSIASKKYIHRLVAETFIDNIYNYPQVNHINGQKKDNNVANLEWCTREYNMNHAYENKLIQLHTQKRKESQLKNIAIARKHKKERRKFCV